MEIKIFDIWDDQVTLDMFAELCQQIASERHLQPQNAKELFEQFQNGLSVVVVGNDKIVAHTTLWELCQLTTGNKWYELGTTWVSTLYRGKNLNHKMYSVLLATHSSKNILATTTNEQSIKVGQDFNMVLVNRHSLPAPVLVATCCCSHKKTGTTTDNIHYCQLELSRNFKPTEKWKIACHVRVTKETFSRNPELLTIKT